MSRFALSSVAAALLAIGASGATAQQPPSSTDSTRAPAPATTAPVNRADPMPGSTGSSYSGTSDSKSWERTHRASKIIGTDVVNRKGEKIGDVEDIVLDAKGNVAYAVVSTGGFLGMGDKMHAVPWSAIRTSTGTDNFMLDVDKDSLRKAPGFDKSNWPNVNDPKWSSENRRYFPASGTTPSSMTNAPGGSK